MFVLIKGLKLWVFTLARFVFWVSFILIASDDPRVSPEWLFNGTWFKFVNMALYAFTNGFCSTCSMILGPGNAPASVKDKAGSTMSAGLLFGIFCGQLASFGFINVGHVPS